MKKLKVLDLFSGIGGFSLGLERTGGFETVAFCEIDKYAQKVLKKHWPDVPIYEDIRSFNGVPADVICGGYPCQPFSLAGKRGGSTDDRHLWPEMYRVIAAVRPRWVIAENVYGHITMGLDNVLSDLKAIEYTCWPFVIPACAVDAKHRRDRVWIVAHTEGERCGEAREPVTGPEKRAAGAGAKSIDVADPGHTRIHEHGVNEIIGEECEFSGGAGIHGVQGWSRQEGKDLADSDSDSGKRFKPRRLDAERWQIERERQIGPRGNGPGCRGIESRLGGIADGLPFEMDPDRYGTPRTATRIKDRAKRIKSLGNAVVPQIPEMIGHAILRTEHEADD